MEKFAEEFYVSKSLPSLLELQGGLNIFMLIAIRRWRQKLDSTVVSYNIIEELKNELLEVEQHLNLMLSPPISIHPDEIKNL